MLKFKPSLHGWPFGNSFLYKIPFASKTIEMGFCGGMCWKALDRFYARIPVDRNIQKPNPGDPLYKEIFSSQVSSLPPGKLAKIFEWQQSPDMGHLLNPHHSLGHKLRASGRE